MLVDCNCTLLDILLHFPSQSGDAANAILKKNDVLCKKVSYIHEENGKTRLLSQSSHTNGFIRKEANAV